MNLFDYCKRSFLLSLAVLLTVGVAGANPGNDGLRAYFDRNTVYSGETVTLTLEASGSNFGGRPDLSPLQRDFSVLSTSQGSEVRIINGQRSDTIRWQIVLQPLTTGDLTVPGISVGARSTEPLTLKVRDLPPEVAKQQAESLFVEMELSDDGQEVYVQQQIPLTVRLFTDLPIREGTLSDPNPENTVVERLGEDRNYSTERNGHRYQVVERHYALFPERSGELTIPAVVFRGSVPVKQRGSRRSSGTSADRFFNDPMFDRAFGNSGFGGLLASPFFSDDPMGMFSARRPVTAQSEALTVTVQPRPQQAGSGTWLPAQSLSLTDSWVDQPPEWQVGKPVERTLTIRATGVAGSQVPQLPLEAPKGTRIYPGKPVNQSRTDGDRVFAVSEQTYTYIPTLPGTIEVPEVKVTWWDTEAQTERVATLPRWQVSVAPGAMAPDAAAEPEPEPDPESAPLPAAVVAAVPEEKPMHWPPTREQLLEYLPWLIGALLLLIVAYLLAKARRSPRQAADRQVRAQTPQGPDQAKARAAFNKACTSNDPAAAARTLLDWAAATWPQHPPTSLAALAKRLASGGDAIKALEQALYAPGEHPWDAQALKKAMSGGLREKPKPSEGAKSDLAPLYPAGSGAG